MENYYNWQKIIKNKKEILNDKKLKLKNLKKFIVLDDYKLRVNILILDLEFEIEELENEIEKLGEKNE